MMTRGDRWTEFACAAITATAMPGNGGGTTEGCALDADRMMELYDGRFPPAEIPKKPEPTSTPSGGIPRTDP